MYSAADVKEDMARLGGQIFVSSNGVTRSPVCRLAVMPIATGWSNYPHKLTDINNEDTSNATLHEKMPVYPLHTLPWVCLVHNLRRVVRMTMVPWCLRRLATNASLHMQDTHT